MPKFLDCPGRNLLLWLIALAFASVGVAENALEIAVRALTRNRFEIVLTSSTVLAEGVAQSYAAQAAARVCGGMTPQLGTYKFESQEALGPGLLKRDPNTFRFIQDLTCSSNAPTAAARVPTHTAPDEAKVIEAEIREKTRQYILALANGEYERAYSQLVPAAVAPDKAAWMKQNEAFRTASGEPRNLTVLKISIYDDPPDAPHPGLYVAADFQNSYASVPYECGYFMWYRARPGQPFQITRAEIGRITSKDLAAIPAGQRSEILLKLRCVAP